MNKQQIQILLDLLPEGEDLCVQVWTKEDLDSLCGDYFEGAELTVEESNRILREVDELFDNTMGAKGTFPAEDHCEVLDELEKHMASKGIGMYGESIEDEE